LKSTTAGGWQFDAKFRFNYYSTETDNDATEANLAPATHSNNDGTRGSSDTGPKRKQGNAL
jgi:hypothetical protein